MSAEPFELLRQLAWRYHRFKQQHKHRGPVSSRSRQHQQVLKELEESFERALDRWVDDETLHEAWLAHFYHFAPEPRGPALPKPPIFKGRDPSGRSAALLPAQGGGYELMIEGKPVRRLSGPVRFPDRPLRSLRVGGFGFAETFDASDAAVEALNEYARDPSRGAPWKYASDLYSDGVVDPNFGLTPRGRRLIDARRGGGGGIDLML